MIQPLFPDTVHQWEVTGTAGQASVGAQIKPIIKKYGYAITTDIQYGP